MFEKVRDNTKNNITYKGYISDLTRGQIINRLMSSDINFESVTITDDGDVGMKSFGGEYSYETFCSIYQGVKDDIENIIFTLPDDTADINVYDNGVVLLVTKDPELDLNELLGKKKTL